MKIKLKDPAYKNFTGHLGMIEFKNGVSVGEVALVEVHRMAAVIAVEGTEGEETSIGDMITRTNKEKAPVLTPTKPADAGVTPDPASGSSQAGQDEQGTSDDQGDQAGQLGQGQAGDSVSETNGSAEGGQAADTPAPLSGPRTYTREELSVIGDKGINPLRAIAEPLGVRANSIGTLIEKILEAQG